MAVFMYMRETNSSAPLLTQQQFADKYGIERTNRLGQEQYTASNCKDVLLFVNRELKAGDELVVYNLLLLGHTHRRLLDVFEGYHKAYIRLYVQDIGYHDLCPASGNPHSENEDYSRMRKFLKVFVTDNDKTVMRRIKEQSHKKPGRPSITFAFLPDKAKEIIRRHIRQPYVYTEKMAIEDINKVYDKGIGITVFRRMVKEQKNLLK